MKTFMTRNEREKDNNIMKERLRMKEGKFEGRERMMKTVE